MPKKIKKPKKVDPNVIVGKFRCGEKFNLRRHRLRYKSWHHIFFDDRQVYVEDNVIDERFKIYRKHAKCPDAADGLWLRLLNAYEHDKQGIPLPPEEEEFITKVVNKWKHINEKGWH